MGTKSGGSGEGGVYIRSYDNYHQPVGVEVIEKIANSVCEKYNAPWVPDFMIMPSAKRRWGCYYYNRKLITLNLPTRLGNLLHELAHHLAICEYGRSIDSHGVEFKRYLQMLLNDYNV